MRNHLPRLSPALWITVISLALTGCAGTLYLELEASHYTVERYTNYAPVVLHEVTNTGNRALTEVVLTASCKEDQFDNLKHEFRSAPFAIGAKETIPAVRLEHVDGWPYFTDFRIGCNFDASNRRFPMEPEVVINLR